MQIEQINALLKVKANELPNNPLQLDANEVANVLATCSDALKAYIVNANEKLGSDSPNHLSKTEIDKIYGVFYELACNFFPMAHSLKLLSELHIIERDEVRNCEYILNSAQHQIRMTQELLDKLKDDMKRLSNP